MNRGSNPTSPPHGFETIRPAKMGDEPRKPHQAVTLEQVRALLAISPTI